MNRNQVNPTFAPEHSEQLTYQVGTLVIGGGPATLGVLAHAYQISKVQELANEIAIVEVGDTLGGGNLQYYFGIRSNTSAHGFLKCIQYPKPKKQKGLQTELSPVVIKKKEYSVGPSTSSTWNSGVGVTQRQAMLKLQGVGGFTPILSEPSSQFNYIPLVMSSFVGFSQSDLAQYLKQVGKLIAPLQIIGCFLSYVGNQMLFDIYQKYSRRIFFPHHKAKSIHINADGTFTTTVEKYSYDVIHGGSGATGVGNNLTNLRIVAKTHVVRVNSKYIVLGTGGKQKIPKNFARKYELSKDAVVMLSDEVLRERNFRKLVQMIHQKDRKITITVIGGSHSAFSIAWLLLNGPCTLRSFSTQPQANQNCSRCSSCPLGLNHKLNQRCLCQQQCKCLSNPVLPSPLTNDFPEGTYPCLVEGRSNFQILYREKIKVYYNNVALAQQDDYGEYDPRFDVSKGGIVYPFTGLRGDAKDLYRRIKKNQEKRVSLIRADDVLEQRIYTKASDIVIIACGYQTNHISIYDASGKKVDLRHLGNNKQNSIEVDSNCKVLQEGGKIMDRIFGIGIGYSLKTIDNLVQAEQRNNTKADSVGLYIKQIGHKLLPQILNRPRTSCLPPTNYHNLPRQQTMFVQRMNSLTISQSQQNQPMTMITKGPFIMTPSKLSPMMQLDRLAIQEAYFENSPSKNQLSEIKKPTSSSVKKKRQSVTASKHQTQQTFFQPQNEKQSVSGLQEEVGIYEINSWYHKSPDLKKSKLLIKSMNSKHGNQSLSSTLNSPLKSNLIHGNPKITGISSNTHKIPRKQEKLSQKEFATFNQRLSKLNLVPPGGLRYGEQGLQSGSGAYIQHLSRKQVVKHQ